MLCLQLARIWWCKSARFWLRWNKFKFVMIFWIFMFVCKTLYFPANKWHKTDSIDFMFWSLIKIKFKEIAKWSNKRHVIMHRFMEICSSKAGLFQSDLKSMGNEEKQKRSILVFDTFSKLIFSTQKPTSSQHPLMILEIGWVFHFLFSLS